MQKNIHKKLMKRLLLGWFFLSILIGGFVYVFEMEKVDGFVKDLAIEESRLLIEDSKDFINSTEEEHQKTLLRHVKQFINKGHFIIIEIYNSKKKLMAEVVLPEYENVEEYLNQSPHDSFLNKTVDYKKLYIDEEIYIQVFAPLDGEDRKNIGFFEGVYKVSSETRAAVNKRIAWSLAQVVFVILITTLVLYPIIISLNKGLIKLSLDLSHANIGMLKVLGGAISKRDGGTNIHNYRVTLLVIRLAELVGLKDEKMKGLIKGAFLHDVGKIGISDSILLKPGNHTDEEHELMKKHVRHGMDIINKYSWLSDAVDVVHFHHERFDGSGYMSALKGKDIPVSARIFSIVDVFDALTSKRPYKEPYSFEKAMEILENGKGTLFDPVFIDAFSKVGKDLYSEVYNIEEDALEEKLDRYLEKYFR